MFTVNNLNYMINQAGLSKKSVAKIKGITPETLSRHIHGKIPLTLNDAKEYSKILNCTPQEVMFKSDPVPIVGYIHYDAAGNETYDLIDDRKNVCGTTEAEIKKIEERDLDSQAGEMHIPVISTQHTGAIIYKFHKDYIGPWIGYHNAINVVNLSPIMNRYVCKSTYQQASYVKIKDGPFGYGHVFPEPGNTYGLHNPWRQSLVSKKIEFQRGLELEWASAVIATIWQPDLSDIKVHSKNTFARKSIPSKVAKKLETPDPENRWANK